MASPQSSAVLNLLLVFGCGAAAWLGGSLTRPSLPPRPQSAAVTGPVTGRQPETFTADARKQLSGPGAGEAAFDDLVTRYGSGSAGLEALAAPLMESWAARDPGSALTAGLARARAHAPGSLPGMFAALAGNTACPPEKLLAALPGAPLHTPCLLAAAAAWGRSGQTVEAASATLPRPGRSDLLREWHRTRALADPAGAAQSAARLTGADDREAAFTGLLHARAESDPPSILQAVMERDDYPQLAETAFRAWTGRDRPAAWAFAATMKDSGRITGVVTALLKAELPRHRIASLMPDAESLFARVFPAGPPMEIVALLLPPLAAERTAPAQKFAASLPEALRAPAGVLLFDALCGADPAAAWRLAAGLATAPGAKDLRGATQWTSATARSFATPEERLAAGFPDLTDMTNLALKWLASDPAAALQSFIAPNVPPPVSRLAVDAAMDSQGAALRRRELLEWARSQSPQMVSTMEKLTAGK